MVGIDAFAVAAAEAGVVAHVVADAAAVVASEVADATVVTTADASTHAQRADDGQANDKRYNFHSFAAPFFVALIFSTAAVSDTVAIANIAAPADPVGAVVVVAVVDAVGVVVS